MVGNFQTWFAQRKSCDVIFNKNGLLDAQLPECRQFYFVYYKKPEH